LSALNFTHRAFVAFEILALAAADITRFFLPISLPPLASFCRETPILAKDLTGQ
jgi:hypothetical protein